MTDKPVMKEIMKNFTFFLIIFCLITGAAFVFAETIKTKKDRVAATTNAIGTEQEKGIELVLVKGGCFQMGDTFHEGSDREQPVHEVCINDFYLGKFEVTQVQWRSIMNRNPSHFLNCGDSCPVENVSWEDAQKFIQKLNQRTGKNYRLPSEAEWEYAARSGGKKEKWAGTNNESSLGDYAWYDANSSEQTHPVGQKQPNGLGLFDMTGNVGEWVQDRYEENYYRNSPRNDPQGPVNGSRWLYRGGGWLHGLRSIRSTYRFNPTRGDYTFTYVGLRLAMNP